MPNWLRKLLEWWNRKPVPPPPPAPSNDAIATLHEIHNGERQLELVNPLVIDSKLMAAAQHHANWMARTGYVSHTGENGSSLWDRMQREGYQPGYGGENIAHGYQRPQDAMLAWMNSSGHRNNILNPAFDHVGYGVISGDGQLYWVAVFASPAYTREAVFEESLPQPLLFSEQST